MSEMTDLGKEQMKLMRAANDFSNIGKKKVDMNKRELCQEVASRLGSLNLKTIRNMKMRDLVSKILKTVEEVQAEALMRGAMSVWSVNGEYAVKSVNERPLNRKVIKDFDKIPPRNKIVFKPGFRIKQLNETLKIMAITEEKEKEE